MSDETERVVEESKRLAREVLIHFFIYSELDELLTPLDEAKVAAASPLVPIIDAFKRNIKALYSVAHLPFSMTQKGVVITTLRIQ